MELLFLGLYFYDNALYNKDFIVYSQCHGMLKRSCFWEVERRDVALDRGVHVNIKIATSISFLNNSDYNLLLNVTQYYGLVWLADVWPAQDIELRSIMSYNHN